MRWAGFDAGGVDTGLPLLGNGAGCGGSGFRSLTVDGTGCAGGGGAGSHGSWVTLSPESFFCHSYRSVRIDEYSHEGDFNIKVVQEKATKAAGGPLSPKWRSVG